MYRACTEQVQRIHKVGCYLLPRVAMAFCSSLNRNTADQPKRFKSPKEYGRLDVCHSWVNHAKRKKKKSHAAVLQWLEWITDLAARLASDVRSRYVT